MMEIDALATPNLQMEKVEGEGKGRWEGVGRHRVEVGGDQIKVARSHDKVANKRRLTIAEPVPVAFTYSSLNPANQRPATLSKRG